MLKTAVPDWYGNKDIQVLGKGMKYRDALKLLDSVTRLSSETDDYVARSIRKALLPVIAQHDKDLWDKLEKRGPEPSPEASNAAKQVDTRTNLTQDQKEKFLGMLDRGNLPKNKQTYNDHSARLSIFGNLARAGQFISNKMRGGDIISETRLNVSGMDPEDPMNKSLTNSEYTKYQMGVLDREIKDRLELPAINYPAGMFTEETAEQGTTNRVLKQLPRGAIKKIHQRAKLIRDIRLGNKTLEQAVAEINPPKPQAENTRSTKSLLRTLTPSAGTATGIALGLLGSYGVYRYLAAKKRKEQEALAVKERKEQEALAAKKIEKELLDSKAIKDQVDLEATELARRRRALARSIAIASGATGVGLGGYAMYRRYR